MEKVRSFLSRHSKVGFDSNILIYVVEAHPQLGEICRNIFKGFAEHRNEVWTSVMTIPEVLIKPLRAGAFHVATDYEHRLFNSPFSFAQISMATGRRSAILGGQYHLDTRDALHLASLLDVGITGFITADEHFKGVKDVEVLLIKARGT